MRKAILFFLFLLPFSAQAETPAWTTQDAHGQTEVHLFLFWSLTCPHCLTARPQILELASQHPWIRLHDHELSENPANVERFIALAKMLGEEAQAVPTLIYCGQMVVGWGDHPGAGGEFLSRLESCRQHGMDSATPLLPTPHLSIPLIGKIDTAKLSLPLLTILLAGLDAFNPCAFFVLLFLLSLLVHQQNHQRMLIIGGVFVAFSGLMYFAFMAAWLNLFRLIGSLPWVTTMAGGLALMIAAVNIKDFIIFKKGISLSIPEKRKSDIFQRGRHILNAGSLPAMLAATVFLAIAANFYELLCTAGFPMVFTRLLTLQVQDTAQHYLYLALYNVIYVLPLLAIVIAFVRTMGSRKLSEREGRLLKLLSGLMMLGLGLLLLIAPEGLSNLGIAFGLLAGAALLTWLAARLFPD